MLPPTLLLTTRMLLSLNVASSSPYPSGMRDMRGELGCIHGWAAWRSLKNVTCQAYRQRILQEHSLVFV